MSRLDWRTVWENKGRLPTRDLVVLDGFENTRIQPDLVADAIKTSLAISEDDFVLEVGCGAGLLAQYMTGRYIGIDYSRPLLAKLREIVGHHGVNAEALQIPLRNKSVDKTYVFSVFHYFPDRQYAAETLRELHRVTRRAIFIGDLPVWSHSTDHLRYEPTFFTGWKITEGFYNPARFNAYVTAVGARITPR